MSYHKSTKFYFMQMMPPWLNRGYADIKSGFDRLRGYKTLKKNFYDSLGYHLDLENPRSYNEKLNWKKLFDRNPLLPITADKYRVRSYVKDVLGENLSRQILIPLYQVVSDSDQIDFENLPDKFVIKPNHGSGMHLLVKDKTEIEFSTIKSLCEEWLYFNYGLYQNEWAYRKIDRLIIIEKLLHCNNGYLPMDYKFYCFHSKCWYIRVSENRFNNHESYAYFDTDWNMLSVSDPGHHKMEAQPPRPENLESMLSIAEKLSARFDAVRIDLFNCEDQIYFGEISHYDASGMSRFDPEKFDFETGNLWEISRNYWLHAKDHIN